MMNRKQGVEKQGVEVRLGSCFRFPTGFLGWVLSAILLAHGPAPIAAAGQAGEAGGEGRGGDFALVPEMQQPEGILFQSRRARESLEGRAEARRGLARLEAWVEAHWPRIRQVDLVSLSRFHVEQTRGFELPADPGELTGRAIAVDEAGLWYLELRGPRLPARYDIVHRYLYVFAGFDPATGELGGLNLTIRGWVLE